VDNTQGPKSRSFSGKDKTGNDNKKNHTPELNMVGKPTYFIGSNALKRPGRANLILFVITLIRYVDGVSTCPRRDI